MAKIVGIGANVFDTLYNIPTYPTEDTKMRATASKTAGGGPVSTGLVAAKKLGEDAAYIGVLSDDNGGKFLKQDFEKYGVDFVQAGHQHIFNITEIVNNIQYATFPCLGAGVATGDVKDEPFEKETILGYYGYAVVDVKNASEAKVTVYGYTKNEATSSAEVAEESKIVLYTFNVTDANK